MLEKRRPFKEKSGVLVFCAGPFQKMRHGRLGMDWSSIPAPCWTGRFDGGFLRGCSLRQASFIAVTLGHFFLVELFEQRHEDAPDRAGVLAEVASGRFSV